MSHAPVPMRWSGPLGARLIESPLGTCVKRVLPDRAAVTLQFYRHLGYVPNLRNPKTYNEKIQYRKFYDRDPRMPPLVDKVGAKAIVAASLGPDWTIPTLWSGTDPAQIPFDTLEPPYVLKPSHASHCTQFVFNAGDIDQKRIRSQAASWLRLDYSRRYYEWVYTQVPRQLLVEPYIGDVTSLPVDLKFGVFHGRVQYIQHIIGEWTEDKQVFYFGRDWNWLPVLRDRSIERQDIPAPRHLSAMLEAAETLAAPFSFARVDFYDTADRPLFGEITFYPNAGYGNRISLEYDRMLGDLWRL